MGSRTSDLQATQPPVHPPTPAGPCWGPVLAEAVLASSWVVWAASEVARAAAPSLASSPASAASGLRDQVSSSSCRQGVASSFASEAARNGASEAARAASSWEEPAASGPGEAGPGPAAATLASVRWSQAWSGRGRGRWLEGQLTARQPPS